VGFRREAFVEEPLILKEISPLGEDNENIVIGLLFPEESSWR
jgi:hypothetical protein